MRLIVCALLWAATAAGAATPAPASRLTSGVYEGLELTVTRDGAVAGSFTRDTDTPPHRVCAFSFTGHIRSDGAASIIVHDFLPATRAVETLLVPTRDGLMLRGKAVAGFPACDQLVQPDSDPGIGFGRTEGPDGAWVATISSARAQLYLKPIGTAWHGYLVKGNYVEVGTLKEGRWSAVFLSPSGIRSRGWLDASQVTLLQRM